MLPYVELVRRVEEAERRVLFILKQAEKHGVPLNKIKDVEALTEHTQMAAEAKRTVSNLIRKSCKSH